MITRVGEIIVQNQLYWDFQDALKNAKLCADAGDTFSFNVWNVEVPIPANYLVKAIQTQIDSMEEWAEENNVEFERVR